MFVCKISNSRNHKKFYNSYWRNFRVIYLFIIFLRRGRSNKKDWKRNFLFKRIQVNEHFWTSSFFLLWPGLVFNVNQFFGQVLKKKNVTVSPPKMLMPRKCKKRFPRKHGSDPLDANMKKCSMPIWRQLDLVTKVR